MTLYLRIAWRTRGPRVTVAAVIHFVHLNYAVLIMSEWFCNRVCFRLDCGSKQGGGGVRFYWNVEEKRKKCGKIGLKSSCALGGIRLSVEEVSFSWCRVMKCVLNVQRENVSLENGEIKSILLLLHLQLLCKEIFFRMGWSSARVQIKQLCLVSSWTIELICWNWSVDD